MHTSTHDEPRSPGGADDRRQQLEREESTTSYPIIGEGYSDTISVVSDITTPTVMPGQTVSLEEHYLPPPMQIDFSRKVNKQKLRRPSLQESGDSKAEQSSSSSSSKPTLTSATKPRTEVVVPTPPPPVVAKPGGAAAKRRQNYAITMAHLEATRGSLPLAAVHEPSSGSLLGKSSQYAASVSAAAASLQTMTLSATTNTTTTTKVEPPPTKEKVRIPKRFSDATASTATTGTMTANSTTTASANHGNVPATKSSSNADQGFPNFNAVVVETKKSNATTTTGVPNMFDDDGFPISGFGNGKQEVENFFSFGNASNNSGDTTSFGSTNLFDQDGFPMAVDASVDPFAISSFGNDFPSTKTDAFASGDGTSFFPASTKDSAKRKKGTSGAAGRRASVGTASITKSPPQLNKSKKKEDVKPESEEKARKRK